MAIYSPNEPVAVAPARTGDLGYAATESRAAGATASAVSWAAIFAGAAAAAALSLVLILLGTGLGMSSVSPWSGQGIEADTFGWATIVWISFTALAASGVGGYLAGRLRTKWSGIHTHEVFFRDTAHGLLAWAVATLLSAALLSSAIGSIVSTGAKAGAAVAGGVASAAMTAGAAGAASAATGQNSSSVDLSGSMNYMVDSLFRSNAAPGTVSAAGAPAENPAAAVKEVTAIFANSLRTGDLSKEDAQYVAQLISQRTGLTQDEAQKRVTDTFAKAKAAVSDAKAKAKAAADAARKATAYGSLWLVVSLLLGAFIASLAATWGGRRRDLQSTI